MDKCNVTFNSCVVINRSVYFVAKEVNAFCRFDLEKKNTTFIDMIPDHLFTDSDLAGKMLIWNGSIVILPFNDDAIRIWDLQKSKWDKIEILDGGKGVYLEGTIYKNNLYAISSNDNIIYKINLVNGENKKIHIHEFDYVTNFYFGARGVQSESILYLPDFNYARILKFNMEDDIYEWITIGDNPGGFISLSMDKGWLYLSSTFGKSITKYNILKESARVLYEQFDDKIEDKSPYLGFSICIENGDCLATSYYKNELVQIKRNGEICLKYGSGRFDCAEVCDDNIFVISNDGEIWIGNSLDGTMEKFPCIISTKEKKENELLLGHELFVDICNEKRGFDLEDLIERVLY